MQNLETLYKKFVSDFSNLIKQQQLNNITFLCIGTSKVIGDSIGPIVGTILKSKFEKSNSIEVLGDLDNNIHYQNLENYINKKGTIIVIDSALSSKENIGKIIIQKKALKYGEGLKKKSSNIGDISIKAVIERNTNNKFINFYKLKKTSNETVKNLACIISKGIIEVMN